MALITARRIASGNLLSRHWIADYDPEPRLDELLGILAINFLLVPLSSPH